MWLYDVSFIRSQMGFLWELAEKLKSKLLEEDLSLYVIKRGQRANFLSIMTFLSGQVSHLSVHFHRVK